MGTLSPSSAGEEGAILLAVAQETTSQVFCEVQASQCLWLPSGPVPSTIPSPWKGRALQAWGLRAFQRCWPPGGFLSPYTSGSSKKCSPFKPLCWAPD